MLAVVSLLGDFCFGNFGELSTFDTNCLIFVYKMNCLLKNLVPRLYKPNLNLARYYAAFGSKEHIESLVKDKKIVVFMKGVPEAPRCGFSNAICQILEFHGVKEFEAHNVLENEDLRQGIKDYSNWPTIPQVYMNGEFVGGCDILLEMHQNGEFIDELKKVGIRSVLLDKKTEGE